MQALLSTTKQTQASKGTGGMYVAELPNRTRGEDNWVTIIKTVNKAGISSSVRPDQTRNTKRKTTTNRNKDTNTIMIAKNACESKKKKPCRVEEEGRGKR
jgi:hypothetical protein